MLTLYIGQSGTGKTTRLVEHIKGDIAAGRRVYLIVPEQQTVSVERDMATVLPESAPLLFEVTNFTRLCDTVFRMHGGVVNGGCSPAVEQLLMWRCLTELSPLLHNRIEAEPKNIAKMRSIVKELRGMRLTPAVLNIAAAASEGALSEKLKDYSLILSTYHALLEEQAGDTSDRMDKLSAILSAHPFSPDTRIYIDNFSSLTEQEYGVVEAILPHTDVTMTLCMPKHADRQLSAAEVEDTRKTLIAIANACGVAVESIRLDTEYRLTDPARAYVAEHLFRIDYATLPPYDGVASDGLRLLECPDPTDACDYAASDIRRRVQNEGLKYSDFAIVCGSASSYVGILDASLEKHDIPFFFSRNRDLLTLEPVKMILLAYTVITGGWRRESVTAYLKCLPADIPQDARDELELYAEMWNIHGARWYDEHAWNMSPSGYGESRTDGQRTYAAEKLKRVNAARETLVAPLTLLSEMNNARHTTEEHIRALTEFLLALSLPDYLEARAAALAPTDKVRAEEFARLWDIICDALDTLSETLAGMLLTAEEFSALLRMLFSAVKIGAIPAALDQVTVGEARMLRTGGVKHVYLLGANEGEFPPPPATELSFTEAERTALGEAGIHLSDSSDGRASRELFSFWRALNMASDSATVLWSRAGISMEVVAPSDAVRRIHRLLGPDYPIRRINPSDMIADLSATAAAGERVGRARGTDAGTAIAHLLRGDDAYTEDIDALETPVCNSDCTLTPDMAQTLWHGDLPMTQSRVQKLKECPFSHFCSYVLKLDAPAPAEFNNATTGTFLHAVLERFFASVRARGIDPHNITPDIREELLAEVQADVIRTTLPSGEEKLPRTRVLLRSLARSAASVVSTLCDEIHNSCFVPAFFELKINTTDPTTPTPVSFDLPDGHRIYIYGSIDRVDTYLENGRAYIRVVDYKTGVKTFDLADIEAGVNLQLLLYLFSIMETDLPDFRRALGIDEDGDIIPAAMLYLSSLTMGGTTATPSSEEEAFTVSGRVPARSGLILNDPAVIDALDTTPDKAYLPISYKKDGEFTKNSLKSLTDLDALGKLKEEIGRTLCELGTALKQGDVNAAPMQDKKHGTAACRYCPYKPICRFTAPDKEKSAGGPPAAADNHESD